MPAQTQWPCKGSSIDQVQGYLHANFEEPQIADTVIVILDEQTMRDETCLLVSEWESELHAGGRLAVRSDFRSSLLDLVNTSIGNMSDELFETEEPDGVIRNDY